MSPIRRSRRSVRHKTYQQIVRRNVLWGLATLLVAAIGLYVIFGGAVPGTGPAQLRVLAKDGGLLRVGAATKVRVAGVDVGQVSGLAPAKGRPGFTVITVDLTKKAPVFRTDATVKIRPRLFLEGNFFLDINPGTPGAPALGSRMIPPGAVTLHVAADEVFSAFDSQTRTNFKQTLKAFGQGLQGGGAKALNTLLKATPDALSDIGTVAKAARGNEDGDLLRVVRQAGGVLSNLQANENGLKGTISNGRAAFDVFAANQANLRKTIVALDTTTKSLMPQLTRIIDSIPEARALVRDARPLVRRLPSFLDTANPALRSLLSLAQSRDVQGLTAELRPTLRTVSQTAAPLGDLAANLRPVAKCVTDNILPILNGVVPDGKLTTNLKVYQELGDTFTGLGASTTNFDANGPWVRYALGLGNQLLSTSDGGSATQAIAQNPPVGSTPAVVSPPPFRGDVPCETQAVPSLDSATTRFTGTVTKANIDKSAVTSVADQALETVQGLDKGGEKLDAIAKQLQTLLGPTETAADRAAAAGTKRDASASTSTKTTEAGR